MGLVWYLAIHSTIFLNYFLLSEAGQVSEVSVVSVIGCVRMNYYTHYTQLTHYTYHTYSTTIRFTAPSSFWVTVMK